MKPTIILIIAILTVCCCSSSFNVEAHPDRILKEFQGLNLPPITSLASRQDQQNALLILLKLIKAVTKVDLEAILKQLQATVDGIITAVQDGVQEIEDLLKSAGVDELISKNIASILLQAAASTSNAVNGMLDLLTWVLSNSDLPAPLQAVIVIIAVVNTSIPAFLEGLLGAILQLIEHEHPEVIDKLPILLEDSVDALRAQVEPLLALLRPLIGGLP